MLSIKNTDSQDSTRSLAYLAKQSSFDMHEWHSLRKQTIIKPIKKSQKAKGNHDCMSLLNGNCFKL